MTILSRSGGVGAAPGVPSRFTSSRMGVGSILVTVVDGLPACAPQRSAGFESSPSLDGSFVRLGTRGLASLRRFTYKLMRLGFSSIVANARPPPLKTVHLQRIFAVEPELAEGR